MRAGLKAFGGVVAVVFGVLAATGTAEAQNGLVGQYYNNSGTANSPPPPPGSPAGTTFTGNPVLTRVDNVVDFGFGTPPGAGVNQDDFMIAWTGRLVVNTAGNHTFQTNSDDGVRLWINGALAIDSWIDQGPTDRTSAAINLAVGNHTLRLEFYENGGGEVCRLRWQPPGAAAQVIIPNGSLLTPAPPAPPTLNPAVVTIDPTTGNPTITITWGAVTGAQDYVIERSVNSGAYATATTTTMTSYVDNTVTFSQQYCYRGRSRSYNGLVSSANSNPPVCATPQPPPPRIGGDNEEGLFDDNCNCASAGAAGNPWLPALAGLLAAMMVFARRR